MEFTIVTSIEKPATRRGRNGKASQYPFAQMPVGASFKVTFNSNDSEEREKISRRIRTAALSYGKTHKEYVFETWTALTSDGEHEADGDGIRVRRIAERKKDAKKGDGGTTGILANGHANGVSASA